MMGLNERNDEIVKGVRGLCDAIGAMAKVRDELGAQYARTQSRDDQRLLLAVARVCAHLVEAGADVPNEFWAAMVMDGAVGAEEVKARLKVLLEAA